jgi:hypothetical protein
MNTLNAFSFSPFSSWSGVKDGRARSIFFAPYSSWSGVKGTHAQRISFS